MKLLLIGLSVLCVVATLMPILAFKQWWVRVFDFPILQVATATLLSLLCWLLIVDLPPLVSLEGGLLLLLTLAFAYQCKVIFSYTGRFNADVFIECLKDLMRNRRRPIVVITDGHPVHKSKKVKKFLTDRKERIQLHILPPYAPDLNPDELV